MKNNRKKIFLLLPTLIFLVAVFDVGTTSGRYDLGTIPFFDDEWGDGTIDIKFNTLNDPSAEEPPGIVEETPTTVYQVQPSDTLTSIAEKFHTTVEALIAYNKIENPDMLQAGTILRIPPTDYVIPETTTEETTSSEPMAETELSSEVVSESEENATTGEMPTEPESQPTDSTEDITNNGTA